VRSAELTLAVAGASALALLVSGCETTQQKSARSKVQAERVLATRHKVLVTRANPFVRAERVTVVRRAGRTAIAVLLRNTGSRPVSDLPISLRVGGRYLNRRAGLTYFQTHTPAIAPGGEATWVFVTRAPVRGASVIVGVHPAVSAEAGRLPSLRASVGARGATVTNSSGVPQYGLVVYAYAQRGTRLLAAGRASLARLAAGKSATVPLRLVGRPGGATVHVEAPPTIFK
jgi:hypothetical protein